MTLAWVITAAPSYARSQTALEVLTARGVDYRVLTLAAANVREYGEVVMRIAATHPHAQLDSSFAGSRPIHQALTDMETGAALARYLEAHKNISDVVIMADRSETGPAAHTVKVMGRTLWHIQGGEVSGNLDDAVRDANTCYADWHLVSTEAARERVIAIGAHPDRVILTGCSSVDLAHRAILTCRPLVTCAELGGTGADLDLSWPFALVIEHAVTTEYGQAPAQLLAIADALLELEIPAVWQWPGPDAGAGDIARLLSRYEHERRELPWHYFRRLPPDRYYDLLRQCVVLIGNSSVGIRECSYLGVPVVNVGTRQQQRERGPNVVDVDYDSAAIVAAVQCQAGRLIERVSLYGDGHAGDRIAEVLDGH